MTSAATPDEIFDVVEYCLEQIEDAAATITFHRYKVEQAVEALRHMPEPDRKMVAFNLYWLADDVVRAQDLAKALGIKHASQVAAYVGPWTGEFCVRHGLQKERRSRSAAPECPECKAAEANARELSQTQRDSEWLEYQRTAAARLAELRSMPYAEYLQTPEWQERRQSKLKRARYRCQLCSSNGQTLDVHHNTYVSRGAELDSDLTVLCRTCHERHHEVPSQ